MFEKLNEYLGEVKLKGMSCNSLAVLYPNDGLEYAKALIFSITNEKNAEGWKDHKFIVSLKSIGGEFKDIIPISVYKEDGLDILKESIEKYLPESMPIYSEDDITDITERELIEEIIREKALNNLDEEVPHGIKVEVERFKKRKNRQKQSVYDIDVNIICEKNSHKGIIIGKDGVMLKKIGSQARIDIENLLQDKVNLKLWVKVRPDWQDNENYLSNIKSKI